MNFAISHHIKLRFLRQTLSKKSLETLLKAYIGNPQKIFNTFRLHISFNCFGKPIDKLDR
ncbi:MAG: hypothetical protein COZ77_08995 [Gallionellales bacterium CG_4_8_14_3_um_filter_54_18]|nr:MAG: hypothetical protein COZ77_08995 [Gallionellales bacterium CG_4_8_14_3_um_filter_54_18]